MHVDGFVRGKGRFLITQYVPTDEKVTRRFPLLLTTGRVLSQYNVGAQTRRTANTDFYAADLLEIHPHDAEERGIREGDRVAVESRVGRTVLPATLTERVAAGRGLHHLPLSRIGRQRDHHRELRLGHQLPRVQGHGGAGPLRHRRIY
jgi:predicted molibdopterin-dependent oxidoreductase YjgC